MAKRTIASLVTPPGRGALATIWVRGPDALNAITACCRIGPGSAARKMKKGELWLGHWQGRQGEPVVVHVARLDRVEIHCHGGLMPVETILRDLSAAGAQSVSWNELTRSSSSTLIEAEALEALARAPTLRTAECLLAQFHGVLADCIWRIQAAIGAASPADSASLTNGIEHDLAQLLARSKVGLHLITPWRVAIVGRPNVGKSSLLNALVGFERAIVHPAAGTTRDLVTSITAVDGWPVELCDSAGIRDARGELETAGIERTRHAIEQSDWQLVVLDRSQPTTDLDLGILEACPSPIVVANKADLPPAWERLDFLPRFLAVSAHTGSGLVELLGRLGTLLGANSPTANDAVPFTPRQVAVLDEAKRSLSAGNLHLACDWLSRMLGQIG